MTTFIPLRKGVCDDVYTLVPMAGEGNVRLETFSEQDVDRDTLRTVLDQQQTKIYTGVKFRQGSAWEWLYLYLACVLPNGLSRLPGQRPGFTPHFGWGSMAALDSGSPALPGRTAHVVWLCRRFGHFLPAAAPSQTRDRTPAVPRTQGISGF
ncbi:hypothetical protein AB0C68_40350 [Streptomyces tendae]|uniref:hypothetical protein n=1 Tax=Streptomyces tendae TaxID=1932 RepID=UPI0033BFF61F